MPLNKYFDRPGNDKGGEGAKVMQEMIQRYGQKKGESVFYATVNKMRKGSPAQKAAQPTLRTSHSRAAAKRLRKQAMARGNKQRAEVEAHAPKWGNEPNAGPVAYQPGSYPRR